jgi:HD-like signal output (HDOD) protein
MQSNLNSVPHLVNSLVEKITLPDVYHHIRSLMVVPEATIDDFAGVINMDSALATRIVKIGNSAFFGYVRKANTVKQAISLIGVMQLHDLLLSSLAIRAFSGVPPEVIDQHSFWRSAIYCGITARLLAKKCKLLVSEKLFTAGLLHEIGHIVMYTKIPEQVQEVILAAQHTDRPLYMLEREILGFDYGQVGSELMRLWNLPEGYQDIATYHMEPYKALLFKEEITLVNLAHCIMLAEESVLKSPLGSYLERSNEMLKHKLSQEAIETIKVNARLHVDEVMDCLWPFAIQPQQYNVIL